MEKFLGSGCPPTVCVFVLLSTEKCTVRLRPSNTKLPAIYAPVKAYRGCFERTQQGKNVVKFKTYRKARNSSPITTDELLYRLVIAYRISNGSVTAKRT